MSQILPPPKPQRGMVIRNLSPRLPERGKVKIGGLGKERTSQSGAKWQPPVKFDHFVVTTLERGEDGNLIPDAAMHGRLGDTPTSLPVRLLYDDPTLNFPTRYACYKGKTLWCSGDGERAQRLNEKGEHFEVSCTCPLADPSIKRGPNEPRCKMNGALSLLIDGATGIGGVWKFRTTSYNSIVELLSTMSFIRQRTGGPLAGIPLVLTVQERPATNPVDGKPVRIFVVGLDFNGTMEELEDAGHSIALRRATMELGIKHIEEEARRMLALSPPSNAPLPDDDAAEEIIKEFYSEQTEQAPSRPTREDFIEQSQDTTGQGPGEAVSSYNFVDDDGVVTHSYDDPDSAADGMIAYLKAAATPEEFDALIGPRDRLVAQLAAEGWDNLETEIMQIGRPDPAAAGRTAAPAATPKSVDLFTQTDHALRETAKGGLKAFQRVWLALPELQRDLVKPHRAEYEQLAREAGA